MQEFDLYINPKKPTLGLYVRKGAGLPDLPCGVEIQGSEFKPVPGSPDVFVASAPEQFKLTVTATLLPGGAVELTYSRYVDESENQLISA